MGWDILWVWCRHRSNDCSLAHRLPTLAFRPSGWQGYSREKSPPRPKPEQPDDSTICCSSNFWHGNPLGTLGNQQNPQICPLKFQCTSSHGNHTVVYFNQGPTLLKSPIFCHSKKGTLDKIAPFQVTKNATLCAQFWEGKSKKPGKHPSKLRIRHLVHAFQI